MADLPEDILLGAWGALGGRGAGDGVDVGFDIEQRAGDERLYPCLGTLVEVEDGEPGRVSTDGVAAFVEDDLAFGVALGGL